MYLHWCEQNRQCATPHHHHQERVVPIGRGPSSPPRRTARPIAARCRHGGNELWIRVGGASRVARGQETSVSVMDSLFMHHPSVPAQQSCVLSLNLYRFMPLCTTVVRCTNPRHNHPAALPATPASARLGTNKIARARYLNATLSVPGLVTMSRVPRLDRFSFLFQLKNFPSFFLFWTSHRKSPV